MSLTKIESKVHRISHMASDVYDFLSDFRKIAKVFEELANDPKIQEQVQEKTNKKISFKDQIEHWEATEDNCNFVIKGFGEAGLQFVEKEPNKLLKLTGYGRSPFEFYLWIQLVEKEAYDTRIRLTIHAELNAMMKLMLKKKLEKGIDQLAEALTRIPYQSLN